jgi:hypothetical protein
MMRVSSSFFLFFTCVFSIVVCFFFEAI